MGKIQKKAKKLNQLTKYLILTYLISWVSWGILIVLINTGVATYSSPLGFVLFLIGGWGPTIAAIAVQKKRSPKSLIKFIFAGNHKAISYLLLFSLLLTATILLSASGTNPDLPLYLFPIYLLSMIFFLGGNEELGWRGVMQPQMEKKMSFPMATILTSITWSVWHLPLWFMAGSGQDELPFAAFAVFGLVLSFALAAIQRKTNVVFYACVFHGLSNALVSFFIIDINWITLVGSVAIIAASLIIWRKDRQKSMKRV